MNQLCLTRVTHNSLTTDKPVVLRFSIELEFRNVGFFWREENWRTSLKCGEARKRTKSKLNQHVMPDVLKLKF